MADFHGFRSTRRKNLDLKFPDEAHKLIGKYYHSFSEQNQRIYKECQKIQVVCKLFFITFCALSAYLCWQIDLHDLQ